MAAGASVEEENSKILYIFLLTYVVPLLDKGLSQISLVVSVPLKYAKRYHMTSKLQKKIVGRLPNYPIKPQ